MNRFLLYTFYFLLILLGINILLYAASKKVYLGSYHNYSLNFNSYLFADSHGRALDNITEKYGIYNFSAGSDSYFDMYRKIEFLIEKTSIDTIYITVDDHTLSSYREKANNLDRSHIFTTPKVHSNYYDFVKIRYLKNYVVLFQPRTRSVIRHYIISKIRNLVLGNQQNDNVDKEMNWEQLSAAERLKKSNNRLQYQYQSDLASSKLHQSLVDIMNTCKANNIVLIGVKFPLSSEYDEILGDITYGADNILKSEGFKVVDYKKVFINQNRLFANQDHLNKDGSYKFVEMLFSAN